MSVINAFLEATGFLILEFSFRFVYVYKMYRQTAENRSHNLFHGVGLGGGGLPPEPALGC